AVARAIQKIAVQRDVLGYHLPALDLRRVCFSRRRKQSAHGQSHSASEANPEPSHGHLFGTYLCHWPSVSTAASALQDGLTVRSTCSKPPGRKSPVSACETLAQRTRSVNPRDFAPRRREALRA